jgi:hypothetical protein
VALREAGDLVIGKNQNSKELFFWLDPFGKPAVHRRKQIANGN